MTDEQDNPDIYAISKLSKPVETVFTPSDSSDIFAIKKENTGRLDSLIGMALGAGVFLCTAYRLDRRLSQDEMGENWKASDLKASRNVIVYLPPSEIRKNESTTEPIRQTAKRVEALEHPRIVPVLYNFTDPEHGFFTVRKHIDGKPLDVYRQEYTRRHKQFPQTKAVKILHDIAHALDYTHGIGIIHGDLFPKNITIGSDDAVYVDNFALLPVQAETASAERKPYLSPEIVDGLAATVHSDVYALAVIAYELFSGRLPYSPETMNDVPLPIPNVPSTVDAVIRKALARDLDDRYDSCGAFVKALETGFQESAKNRSAVLTPTKKAVRKKSVARRVFSSVALFALLIMGIGIGGGIALLALPKESQEQWFAYAQRMVNGETSMIDEPMPIPSEPPSESAAVDIPKPEPKIPLRTVKPAIPPIDVSPPPVVPPEPDPVVASPTEPEPVVDPLVETPNEPKQGDSDTVHSGESKASPSTSPIDELPEGKILQWQIPVNYINIVSNFRWCKPPEGTGFWIQETPVTHEFWQAIMRRASVREQPSFGSGVPIRRVSWHECQQFIDILNRSELRVMEGAAFDGFMFALPIEAQWTYAQNKGFLFIHEKTLEWCNDLYDGTRNRVVRGGDNQRNGRDPELWYDYIGFRLVIVPKSAE